MIKSNIEKELEYFKSAKNYFNSNPQEYEKSLEELNKISLLIKNITIIHLKTLSLLMLTRYEDIIEFYYIYRKHFDSIFNDGSNDIETNEIKKIISIAFYNLGMRQKAKKICSDIKDNFQIIKIEHQIIQKKDYNRIKINKGTKKKLQSNRLSRINESILLENIEENLEKNLKTKKKEEIDNDNKAKDLYVVSSEFVDNLFESAMESSKTEYKNHEFKIEENEYKNIIENKNDNNNNEIEGPNGGFIEENDTIISNESNDSKLFDKLKKELNSNYNNNIQKEDGTFITFEEKIKNNELKKEKDEKYKDDNDKIDEEDKNKNDKNEVNGYNEEENKAENKGKTEKANSNRSYKQKDIKRALNNQKIPLTKKLTKEKIFNKISLDKNNKKENKNKENEENKNEDKKENKENEELNENKKEIEINSKIKEKEKSKEEKNLENKEEIENNGIGKKVDENEENKDLNKEENKNENKEENKNENKEENKDLNKEENKEENKNENKDDKDEKIEKHKHNNNNFIKKSYTHNKKMNFINKEIKRIYPNTITNDKNNSIRNEGSHETNKRISDGFIKNCKTYGFKNPFDFSFNPDDGGSFKPISSKSSQNENKTNSNENININDKKEDNKNEDNEYGVNINHNRALLRVEIDGEQIDLVQNENPSRKDSKYDNYINIDYNEFSNKKRKIMIDKFRESAVQNFDIKSKTILPKSSNKVNSFNLRGNKNIKPLNLNEDGLSFSSNDKTQLNLKKTCFYKTSYFLDKFDSKIK